MCGINGIFFVSKNVTKKMLNVMNDALSHRGPDDEGIFIDKSKRVGLGHRRLSIIDLSSKGHQPMFDSTKRYVIVFNGEIYNYKELRDMLEEKFSVKFKSNTDTEVILEMYARFGPKCLEFLNGMFAFAIYDTKEKSLFLARDRVGLKPLVYAINDDGFFFSSEIPAILKLNFIDRKINVDALQFYFLRNFMSIPEPFTIFKDVYKLEPSHYMIVKEGKIVEKKMYWSPSFKCKRYTPLYVRNTLKSAVELRTIADVPISVLLSGGVDSSSVVSFLPSKTLTYAFGVDERDEELRRAKRVAEIFSSRLKIILLNVDQIKELKEIISKLGEPVYNLPLTYAYDISHEIHADGIKVALTGNGGDEIFYGYNGSFNLLILSILLRFLEILPKPLLNLIGKLPGNVGLVFRMAALPMEKRKLLLYREEASILFPKLFSPEILKSLNFSTLDNVFTYWAKRCKSKWYIDCSYWLGLMLENKHSITLASDTPGMAHSVEFRSPFLDHRLIDLAFSISPFEKVDLFSKQNKKVLKKAMEGILPKDILYAKKMGFGYNVNVAEKIRREWKDEIYGKLLNGHVINSGLFNPEYIKNVLDEHMHGHNMTNLILALYALEIWWELFMVKS